MVGKFRGYLQLCRLDDLATDKSEGDQRQRPLSDDPPLDQALWRRRDRHYNILYRQHSRPPGHELLCRRQACD